MFSTKTVMAQTARREPWGNFGLALLVSSCALIFVPLSYENPIGWFIGLLIISYIFIYFSMGLRSHITIGKESQHTIHIQDRYSNYISRQVPFKCITHIEICEYRLYDKDYYYPDGVNKDFFYSFTLFGYKGPGLIVYYQLPKSMTDDSIVRGIRFPSPKANEFLSFVKDNTSTSNQTL
jgi:hypothetical protein